MKPHLIVIAGLIGLAGCVQPAPIAVSSAQRIVAPNAAQTGVVGYAGEWLPTDADLTLVEREVGELFAQPDNRLKGLITRDGRPPPRALAPLSDYFVRYTGVIEGGRRLIVGNAAHRSQTDPARFFDLQGAVYLAPFGGGSYFFTVVFDSDAGKLVEVTYNAPL